MGNVFNRYGAGGGKSEGLYIWKKSSIGYVAKSTEEKQNAVLMSNVYTPPKYYEADGYVLNDDGTATLTNPTEKTISSNGTAKLLSGKYYMVGATTGNRMVTHNYTSVSYYPSIIHTSSAQTMSVQPYNTNYPFTLIDIVLEPTFIGYVVSDKETDYPDKAVKDGYYYEKAISSKDLFGSDNVVVGSATPTSNVRSFSIANTVGTIPKLAIIESANQSSYFNYGVWVFDSSGANGATGYCAGGSGYYNNAAGGAVNASTITFMVRNTSSQYFQANTKLSYLIVY